jgi:hypothetical protein
MKRKKKNLMVNGYRWLRIDREREREREEVSKKKERLGSLSQKPETPGTRPCLSFNPSRGDNPKTDQARPFL